MKELNARISVTEDYDRFARRAPYCPVQLGDLTEKQYKALEDVVRLSPGYYFLVRRYEEHEKAHGSGATHVSVFKNEEMENEIALVGRDCAQYYDGSKETEQVVKRISHRVYRKCVYFA